MQRCRTIFSSQVLNRCRFIQHPNSRFVSQSVRTIVPRKEFLIVIERGICSVLLNSQRYYAYKADQSRRRLENDTKNDAFARNMKITKFGKEGKWREILQLYEREKGQFNNVNLATAFFQLGKMRNLDRCDPLFHAFVNGYARCLRDRGLKWAGLREVGNVVYIIGKMKLKLSETRWILEFVSQKENARKIVREGDAQQVANIAWSFAKLGLSSPNLFAEIETRADWFIENGKPQEVANLAWAFATMNIKSPKLCAAIERRGRPGNGTNDDPFARNEKIINFGKEGKWREIFQLVDREKDQFNDVNWSTTFSQLGRIRDLDHRSPFLKSLVNKYAKYLRARGIERAGIRPVSNILHAIAKMQLKDQATESFLEFLSRKENAHKLVHKQHPQDIAITAWSFAKLDVKSPVLFAEIENCADWLVREGDPQAVANVVWAFATLSFSSSKLFAEVEKRASWLVEKGTPQAVANTAWAFAIMNVESPKLFAEIENHAHWLVQNGTSQAVANIIWAASQFQYYSPKLMHQTDSCGTWLVEEGTTQGVSNVALAFAKHGYKPTTFITAITNNISKLINDANQQEIISVCFAMATMDLGKKHSGVFCQLWNAVIDQDPEMLTNDSLAQLGQTLVFCTAAGMKLRQPSALLTRKIGAVVSDSLQSAHQREVVDSLGQLYVEYKEEVSPLEGSDFDNGMLSIDIACESNMLAIEYDGESHFLKQLGTGEVTWRESGATKAKRRFLQRCGWSVVNIDYRDWESAKRMDRQLEFLSERLYQGEKCEALNNNI